MNDDYKIINKELDQCLDEGAQGNYTHQWKWLARVSQRSISSSCFGHSHTHLVPLVPLLFPPPSSFSPPFLCCNFLCCFQNPRESQRQRPRERESEREKLIDWLRENFFSHWSIKIPTLIQTRLGLLSLRGWEYNIYWCVHVSPVLEQGGNSSMWSIFPRLGNQRFFTHKREKNINPKHQIIKINIYQWRNVSFSFCSYILFFLFYFFLLLRCIGVTMIKLSVF